MFDERNNSAHETHGTREKENSAFIADSQPMAVLAHPELFGQPGSGG
jgi:hypothetical protein